MTFTIPKFLCPECKEPIGTPQLFPKASMEQETPADGAKCSMCGWSGQFEDALKEKK